MTVTLDSGKEVKAKVIGDRSQDRPRLLKIEQSGDYPYVKLAKELPRIGDWVLAIGNPFGLGGTVTAGIVSAEGRDIGSGPYDQFIQIDAPINKGNSGGPTFNLKGEVVGVNTAIFSPSGGSVGLGFAIPSQTVDMIVAELQHGGVKRGYLGVQIQPVTQEIADGLGLKTNDGALVAETQPDTPAAAAGLKSGDVITKLNSETVKNAADLTRKVGALKPGDKAQVTYIRNGDEKTAEVTLGALQPRKDRRRRHGAEPEKARADARRRTGPERERQGRRGRQRRSAGTGRLEGHHRRRRDPGSRRQAGDFAARGEVGDRDRQEGRQEGGGDAGEDPQASRFVAFEFPKA